MFFTCIDQACNQLGTPGGKKSFLRAAQIFWNLCPNYVQHIFQAAKKFAGVAALRLPFTFCAPKDSSCLWPVTSLWGGFVGLIPSQKAASPPNWNSKYCKSWKFSFSQCQAPPHKRNAPLLKTFWQQLWMQPCCWVISILFVWSQKMVLTQQHISNWNVWVSCAHKPKILYVIKNKKILKKFQQLQ